MAIVGAHMLFYTPEAQALRAVLRDTLGWPYVEHAESAPGWLIFKLPPAELGVHPSEGSTKHEIAFMCDDINETVAELRAEGIEFRGEPTDADFGITITMLLPGGVEVLLYEPKHRRAIDL
jgi:catechol 2,3-dioxygenase-like lactoylglutathione lyase family enzyme